VSARSTSYEPRCPAQSALYQIVHDHFETFRAQAASLRDREGLPRFVEEELRSFLQCGWLAGGFARFYCDDCALAGQSRSSPTMTEGLMCVYLGSGS
jgi:hypothetical protein